MNKVNHIEKINDVKHRISEKMQLLKGGRKQVLGIKPRGTKVKEVIPIRHFATGSEARVVDADVIIERRGKQRTKKMVEKYYYTQGYEESGKVAPKNFTNPIAQFNTMYKLIKLNREKKLGLRIVPTIRLRRRTRKRPTIIMTKLDEIQLTQDQKKDFDSDVQRQIAILNQQGYKVMDDAFLPIMDKTMNRVVAIIADFGTIQKKAKNKI